NYEEYDDLPEDHSEEPTREPDPVTSAIPLLDLQDALDPEDGQTVPDSGAGPAGTSTDGAAAADEEEADDAQ
ncbi:MAG: circularly permuted type 2 ATP-grasp protein, partial [Brachybacterium tyrofermentans]